MARVKRLVTLYGSPSLPNCLLLSKLIFAYFCNSFKISFLKIRGCGGLVLNEPK
jgi:hypothetical protein